MAAKKEKYLKHIASAFGVDCNLFEVGLKQFAASSNLYCRQCTRPCDFQKTHLYGCYEAMRWDNKYIYYCPAGYIFIAVALYDEQGMLIEGVITGPMLMGDKEDFFEAERLPLFSPERVNDMTEIICAMFTGAAKEEAAEVSTEAFLNAIYRELEVLPTDKTYPIALEKELQIAIVEHDAKRSKEILNRLLGQIFFQTNGDFDLIKTRALELIVLLSRAAIEGGADIAQIFTLNHSYLTEIAHFKTLEQLSTWLSHIINRFVSYVFELNDVKHIDTIYKITTYIKSNYMKRITLEDIAEHVYLSKSYISKIFKEEMGIGIAGYINKTRVEKSKPLLLDSTLSLADVANLVGFDDQSYFTKMFKSITGTSPGRYREKHGKIN